MGNRYPKIEKLKKRNDLNLLFSKGKKVNNGEVTFLYLKQSSKDANIKFGVAVSKKQFKKAVDRNKVKRLMRECYRLNKPLLLDALPGSYLCVLIYSHNTIVNFHTLEKKYLEIIKTIAV